MRTLLFSCFIALFIISCNGQATNKPAFVSKTDSIAKPKLITLQFVLEDKPCLATIDERYNAFNHKAEFPLSVFITIKTLEKDKNGHPTAIEAKFFEVIEKEILSELDKISLNAFIGNTTLNGFRDLIFYIKTEDQLKVNEALLKLKEKHNRIKEFTFENDPDWEAVAEFYQAIDKTN